jgi:hypothetical protein
MAISRDLSANIECKPQSNQTRSLYRRFFDNGSQPQWKHGLMTTDINGEKRISILSDRKCEFEREIVASKARRKSCRSIPTWNAETC